MNSLTTAKTNLLKLNNNLIKAEIVADSLDSRGNRLTTFVCHLPRLILSEFNTHRLFSRNSASSRAVPFQKFCQIIKEQPFIPRNWMKEHKGMQGDAYFSNSQKISQLEKRWLQGRDQALETAQKLSELGLTKQLCNRILEPFLMHTVIVSATEWSNFFALRADNEAEIHIGELAMKMLQAYNQSQPQLLQEGQWHIPFGGHFRHKEIAQIAQRDGLSSQEVKIAIATARCARVSYLNFSGQDNYQKDLALFKKLSSSGHWSPFEHCARVMSEGEYQKMIRYENNQLEPGWLGNYRGFIQWRKTFKGENRIDKRILKQGVL